MFSNVQLEYKSLIIKIAESLRFFFHLLVKICNLSTKHSVCCMHYFVIIHWQKIKLSRTKETNKFYPHWVCKKIDDVIEIKVVKLYSVNIRLILINSYLNLVKTR